MSVNIYRRVWLALACLCVSGVLMAQSKHMSFQGVSMEKKTDAFCESLMQKGFTKMSGLNMRGNVWDVSVLANVIGNDKTQRVNSVTLMTAASQFATDKKDKASLNELAPRVISYLQQSIMSEYECIDITGKPYVKGKGESWTDERSGDWHLPVIYVAGKKGRPCGIIDLYLRETADDICIYADFVDIKNSGIEELHRIEEE